MTVPAPVDPKYYARKYPEPPQPYPVPLVTSADPRPAGVTEPGPVLDLQMHAQMHGWMHRTTYSEGYLPHASYGTPGRTAKKIWAVRLERNGSRAVAVRHDDSWASLWVWSRKRGRERVAGLEVFKLELSREW